MHAQLMHEDVLAAFYFACVFCIIIELLLDFQVEILQYEYTQKLVLAAERDTVPRDWFILEAFKNLEV